MMESDNTKCFSNTGFEYFRAAQMDDDDCGKTKQKKLCLWEWGQMLKVLVKTF